MFSNLSKIERSLSHAQGQFMDSYSSKMAGILMQWETAMVTYMNIGKQLTAHLVSKVALSGNGLIRSRTLTFLLYTADYQHHVKTLNIKLSCTSKKR